MAIQTETQTKKHPTLNHYDIGMSHLCSSYLKQHTDKEKQSSSAPDPLA